MLKDWDWACWDIPYRRFARKANMVIVLSDLKLYDNTVAMTPDGFLTSCIGESIMASHIAHDLNADIFQREKTGNTTSYKSGVPLPWTMAGTSLGGTTEQSRTWGTAPQSPPGPSASIGAPAHTTLFCPSWPRAREQPQKRRSRREQEPTNVSAKNTLQGSPAGWCFPSIQARRSAVHKYGGKWKGVYVKTDKTYITLGNLQCGCR